jgi:hypothetical protein
MAMQRLRAKRASGKVLRDHENRPLSARRGTADDQADRRTSPMSEGGVCWLYTRRRAPIVSPRRAIIGTLSASGARNTERCLLRWRDLDFPLPVLKDPHTGVEHKPRHPRDRHDPVAARAAARLQGEPGQGPAREPGIPYAEGSFRNKDPRGGIIGGFDGVWTRLASPARLHLPPAISGRAGGASHAQPLAKFPH